MSPASLFSTWDQHYLFLIHLYFMLIYMTKQMCLCVCILLFFFFLNIEVPCTLHLVFPMFHLSFFFFLIFETVGSKSLLV